MVEYPDYPQADWSCGPGEEITVKNLIIREVKPITREQMSQTFESAPACMHGTDLLRECLVSLGIEVEG